LFAIRAGLYDAVQPAGIARLLAAVARRLEDVVGRTRNVPMDFDLLQTAKALGVTFGD
jgi:hypothetical protein